MSDSENQNCNLNQDPKTSNQLNRLKLRRASSMSMNHTKVTLDEMFDKLYSLTSEWSDRETLSKEQTFELINRLKEMKSQLEHRRESSDLLNDAHNHSSKSSAEMSLKSKASKSTNSSETNVSDVFADIYNKDNQELLDEDAENNNIHYAHNIGRQSDASSRNKDRNSKNNEGGFADSNNRKLLQVSEMNSLLERKVAMLQRHVDRLKLSQETSSQNSQLANALVGTDIQQAHCEVQTDPIEEESRWAQKSLEWAEKESIFKTAEESYKSTVAILRHKLEELSESKTSGIRTMRDKLDDAEEAHATELAELRNQIASLKERCELLENDLVGEKHENSKLSAKLESASLEMETTMDGKIRQEELILWQADAQQLRESVRLLSASVSSADVVKNRLEKTIKEQQHKVELLEIDCASWKTAMERMTKLLADADSDRSDLMDQLLSRGKSHLTVNTRTRRQDGQYFVDNMAVDIEAYMEFLETRNDFLATHAEELRQVLEATQTKHDLSVAENMAQVDALESRLTQNTLNATEQAHAKFSESVKKIEVDFQNELQALVAQHEESQADLSDMYKKKLHGLQTLNDELENDVDSLRKKLHEANNRLDETTVELNSTKSTSKEIKESADYLLSENNTLVLQLEEAENELEKVRNELQSSTSKITTAMADLEQSTSEKADTSAHVRILQNKIAHQYDSIKTMQSQHQSQYGVIEEQLQRTRQHHDALANAYEALQKTMASEKILQSQLGMQYEDVRAMCVALQENFSQQQLAPSLLISSSTTTQTDAINDDDQAARIAQKLLRFRQALGNLVSQATSRSVDDSASVCTIDQYEELEAFTEQCIHWSLEWVTVVCNDRNYLHNELVNMKSEFKVMHDKLSATRKELKTRAALVEKLRSEKKQLGDQLVAEHDVVKHLREMNENNKEEVLNVSKQLQNAHTLLEEHARSKQVVHVDMCHRGTLTETDFLQVQLDQKRQEMEEMKMALQDMARDVTGLRAERSRFESLLHVSETKIQQLASECLTLESQVTLLQNENGRLVVDKLDATTMSSKSTNHVALQASMPIHENASMMKRLQDENHQLQIQVGDLATKLQSKFPSCMTHEMQSQTDFPASMSSTCDTEDNTMTVSVQTERPMMQSVSCDAVVMHGEVFVQTDRIVTVSRSCDAYGNYCDGQSQSDAVETCAVSSNTSIDTVAACVQTENTSMISFGTGSEMGDDLILLDQSKRPKTESVSCDAMVANGEVCVQTDDIISVSRSCDAYSDRSDQQAQTDHVVTCTASSNTMISTTACIQTESRSMVSTGCVTNPVVCVSTGCNTTPTNVDAIGLQTDAPRKSSPSVSKAVSCDTQTEELWRAGSQQQTSTNDTQTDIVSYQNASCDALFSNSCEIDENATQTITVSFVTTGSDAISNQQVVGQTQTIPVACVNIACNTESSSSIVHNASTQANFTQECTKCNEFEHLVEAYIRNEMEQNSKIEELEELLRTYVTEALNVLYHTTSSMTEKPAIKYLLMSTDVEAIAKHPTTQGAMAQILDLMLAHQTQLNEQLNEQYSFNHENESNIQELTALRHLNEKLIAHEEVLEKKITQLENDAKNTSTISIASSTHLNDSDMVHLAGSLIKNVALSDIVDPYETYASSSRSSAGDSLSDFRAESRLISENAMERLKKRITDLEDEIEMERTHSGLLSRQMDSMKQSFENEVALRWIQGASSSNSTKVVSESWNDSFESWNHPSAPQLRGLYNQIESVLKSQTNRVTLHALLSDVMQKMLHVVIESSEHEKRLQAELSSWRSSATNDAQRYAELLELLNRETRHRDSSFDSHRARVWDLAELE